MRVSGFSVWPASVTPLPTRARPKTLTFSMAQTLTISMAIDILSLPDAEVSFSSDQGSVSHPSPKMESVLLGHVGACFRQWPARGPESSPWNP